MKKLRQSNKGFSLVELIIVIAIMAILVGVMAPQLIRYIEKGKVSADTQFCDTLHSAITYALMDPDVQAATDDSKMWIQLFTSPYTGLDIPLCSVPGGITISPSERHCKFTETVAEVMGFNPWDCAPADLGLQSRLCRNGRLHLCLAGGKQHDHQRKKEWEVHLLFLSSA